MFRAIQIVTVLFLNCWLSIDASIGQDSASSQVEKNILKYGSFESSSQEMYDVWGIQADQLDESEFSDGSKSLFMELQKTDGEARPFTAISQVVDAKAMHGTKVRFSAAVKSKAPEANGQVLLWMRVDGKNKKGESKTIAFDNMQDRPIKSESWERHEIVLKVSDEAEKVMAGMIISGDAKAWMDDARMEIVDDEIKTTGMDRESPASPFFTPWMLLAAFAAGLMLLSQMENNFLQRFALKFTFAYFVLYSFSDLIVGTAFRIAGSLGETGLDVSYLQTAAASLSSGSQNATNSIVGFISTNILRMDAPAMLPSGSGDTTFDWARVFSCVVIALGIAIVWSAAWRKNDELGRLRDLLRTWLRYVLALSLMGYGLAKAGFISTQFAPAGMQLDGLLERSYGESSPMGLLWTFMGVSPMYTFFAGVMEVIPAVLLIFRRTTNLGALLALAVMGNVVMLNLCYDVPVKQYSAHLALMATLILLPEVPRMMNLLVWNRTVEPSTLTEQTFAKSKYGIWTYRMVKTTLIVLVFVVPIGTHVIKEVQHEHSVKTDESEHLLLNRGFRWVSEFPYNR